MFTALPAWLLAILFGLLGAILGSFIATLCLRWPAGRSVLTGRSQCDGCGRTLGATELIPLLSAFLSRGRCRSCHGAIDDSHSRIELAALMAGAAPFLLLPPIPAMAWAILAWLLIPLIWLDHRYLWLPHALLLPLAVIGAACGGWLSGEPLVPRLIGGIGGFAVLAALAAAFQRLRGKQGMGAGDPKMLGALGLWFGWQALPILLLIASAMGLATALAHRRTTPLAEQRIALGSAMGLAALLLGLILPAA